MEGCPRCLYRQLLRAVIALGEAGAGAGAAGAGAAAEMQRLIRAEAPLAALIMFGTSKLALGSEVSRAGASACHGQRLHPAADGMASGRMKNAQKNRHRSMLMPRA